MSRKFKLEIDLSNDSFSGGPAGEVWEIFRILAALISNKDSQDDLESFSDAHVNLFDYYGNKVGKAEIVTTKRGK